MSDLARISDPNPTSDLVPLIAAREMFMSEPGEANEWQEALIKQLTGGEPIKVRRIVGEWFEFDPEFTLRISGQHKPDSRDPEQ